MILMSLVEERKRLKPLQSTRKGVLKRFNGNSVIIRISAVAESMEQPIYNEVQRISQALGTERF